jgi:hypothetical protein
MKDVIVKVVARTYTNIFTITIITFTTDFVITDFHHNLHLLMVYFYI